MNLTQICARVSLLIVAGFAAVSLQSCASRTDSDPSRGGARKRVYNPQTQDYEWQKKRGDAPTSAGAETAPVYR